MKTSAKGLEFLFTLLCLTHFPLSCNSGRVSGTLFLLFCNSKTFESEESYRNKDYRRSVISD
jgi:hypothetical protein